MSEKSRKNEIKKRKRIMIIITVILCIILTGEVILYAWFTRSKSLKTVTMINTPYRLNLGAGNNEDITRLSLGNIDVKSDEFVDSETGEGKNFYVFSVSSDFDATNPYVIQLSHTTNIAFNYKIYRAESLGENKDKMPAGTPRQNGLVEYVALDNKTLYYCIDRDSDNKLRNVELISQNLSDDNRNAIEFKKTYAEYEKVQKHAQPVYYKTNALNPEGFTSGEVSFVDYYILEISWNTDMTKGDTVSNDKETDLVYLMALRL